MLVSCLLYYLSSPQVIFSQTNGGERCLREGRKPKALGPVCFDRMHRHESIPACMIRFSVLGLARPSRKTHSCDLRRNLLTVTHNGVVEI